MVNEEQPAVAESTAPTSAPASVPPTRPRRWPIVLILALVGVVGFGGVTGLYFYNKATEPDRSTPVISADAFLHALLVNQDEVGIALYTCPAFPAARALDLKRTLVDPEARATWDSFVVLSESEAHAVIAARLRLQYPGDVAPSGEADLRLDLVNETGWRVCAMKRADAAP